MNRGYIKLWRKVLDSGLLQNGPAWQLFSYLLITAAYRPCRKIVDGVVAELEPGQAVFGRARVAAELNLSEKNVRTALELLKKLEMVATRTTNRFTIITVINWHHYQDERPATGQQNGQQNGQQSGQPEDQQGGQQVANTRPTGGQQSPAHQDLEKESKNINNNINTASAAPDAEHSFSSASPEGGETGDTAAPADAPADEPRYLTRRGRELTGRRLAGFEQFFEAYALRKGKAEAADAWMDIPVLTDALVRHICYAATCEAAARPDIEGKGQAPKWAAGWLEARRWEDYAPRTPPAQARAAPPGGAEVQEKSEEQTEQEREAVLAQLRAWHASQAEDL